MTQGAPQEHDVAAGPAFDPSVPSPARVWNFWVGGKDHFEADRALAGRFGEVVPQMPLIARLTRLFLADTVSQLAAAGIRQFLDIGTGLPTADNTHEVAQRLAPALQRAGLGSVQRPRSRTGQPVLRRPRADPTGPDQPQPVDGGHRRRRPRAG